MPPTSDPAAPDFAALDDAGLNLHAVFDFASLPADVRAQLQRDVCTPHACRQLILIGNAGRALWAALRASGFSAADPIDAFSVRAVAQWFARQLPGHRYTLLYPGEAPVGLQALGRLAGWHHATPFKVGILPGWGSWFGYRVALLADTALPPTPPLQVESPCLSCAARPCIAACPAEAMAGGDFALDRCAAHRLQPDSDCAYRCAARDACPVGQDHRYEADHLRHTYGASLGALARYFRG